MKCFFLFESDVAYLFTLFDIWCVFLGRSFSSIQKAWIQTWRSRGSFKADRARQKWDSVDATWTGLEPSRLSARESLVFPSQVLNLQIPEIPTKTLQKVLTYFFVRWKVIICTYTHICCFLFRGDGVVDHCICIFRYGWNDWLGQLATSTLLRQVLVLPPVMQSNCRWKACHRYDVLWPCEWKF